MLVPLGAAVSVPPQVLLALGVENNTKPPVKVSVTAAPTKATLLGLLSVKVKVDCPLILICVGPKLLAMLGLSKIRVASFTELFAWLLAGSPPPDTSAVLVTPSAAVRETFTVTVSTGKAAPGAIGAPDQVHTKAAQFHPAAPVMLTKLKPAGSVSVTVILPAVLPEPVLLTVIV